MKAVEAFWQGILDLESKHGLYIVHGGKEGSIIINGDSDVVAIVAISGELHVLSDDEFKAINRCPVVSRKFEI